MRKTNARVVINRENANRVRLALADGLLNVAQAIVDNAHPPDDPATSKVIEGGAVGYIDGRKIGGQAQKPSRERGLKDKGIAAFAGWGFPARFQEIGTVHQPARPFGWPAMEQTRGQAPGLMREAATALRNR